MKPRNPEIVAQEVDAIADNLGMPVDDGIKKPVIALRAWNFPTDGSCEGHLPPREACQYPWVDIYAPEESSETAWRAVHAELREQLEGLITGYYRSTHKDALFQLQPIGIFGAFRLVPKTFNVSASEETLIRDRQNFNDFADYLLSRVN